MLLLDRKRPGLQQPARTLAASVVRFAAAATWRALHPAVRGKFLESLPPPPLRRLYYEADDGWRSVVFHLPPAPGGAGEPVVLSHGLGMAGDVFRYGNGPTLAQSLAAAGFSVYLLCHRGDRESLVRGAFSFDDIVERDLPAALQRVCEDAGFPRVHWLGHGFGGQLGLAWAGYGGGDRLATMTSLCAPVRFTRPSSQMMRWSLVSRMIPAHWCFPARIVSRMLTPIGGYGEMMTCGASPPARVRGVMEYASSDVPAGLVGQMMQWLEGGSMTSLTGLDYVEALTKVRLPLLVLFGDADRVCPVGSGDVAAAHWGGVDKEVIRLEGGYGHLDVLLGNDAPKEVFAPVIRWLEQRRRLAWARDGELMAVN
ncbi:MAG: alpha/beta fold hydrolase [Proteobacteria bacterium]|nr:alpha/beta fold hydrolase [Pseudomonadota bacterium]